MKNQGFRIHDLYFSLLVEYDFSLPILIIIFKINGKKYTGNLYFSLLVEYDFSLPILVKI